MMPHSRFEDLHELQMSSPSDGQPCVSSYQDESQFQFETPQWGYVGSEMWGGDFSSMVSGHGQFLETGAHSSDTLHTQYEAFEPRYVWEGSFGHRQDKGVDEWMSAVSPENCWSYVEINDVGMYGGEGQEQSFVSDAAESQPTDHAYGGSELQLQDMLAESGPPFKQYIDHSYGSTANEDSGRQSENPTASAQAGVPQYACFRAAKEAIVPKHWRCPADDLTIPKTDADRHRYIRKLLAALDNVENTIGVHGHSFKKRWYDPTKGHSNYYTPLVKEALCWLILSQAESLHTQGPSETFTSFDPNFWTAAKRTCRWSFSERIDTIAELLATSKSKCDALLGGGSLQLVVANPGQRLRATKADVRQNAKRKELLEAVKGKEKLKKKAKIEPRD